jgi:hypothetical protein
MRCSGYSVWCAIAGLFFAAHSQPAPAADLHGNPSNYRAMLGALKPGDTLILAPGVYRDGLPLHNLKGTPDHPIRIAGPAEEPPAEFLGREGHNTVSLSNTAHVHIGRLVLNGANLAVGAVKAEGHKSCVSVHHIVLEDLLIIGHGADQQIVGISSFCPAWNWIIRRNMIIGAGTGLYLGNSDGSAPFVGGLIEQNLVVDTLGYNLQIKHQTGRPAVAGMPMQPMRTVIRHNVLSKAHGASTGASARPNLLLGHFPRQGAGSNDVYAITNNLFFCNPSESLLQAEGNLSIVRNIFVNAEGDAIVIRPHNDMPRHVEVLRNFVAASGKSIALSDAPPGYTQLITGNAIYSPAAATGGKQSDNRVSPFNLAESSLPRWLGAEQEAASGNNEFAPLFDVALRVCATRKDENHEQSSRPRDVLRNHPVCHFVTRLSAAINRPHAPVAAAVSARLADGGQCAMK